MAIKKKREIRPCVFPLFSRNEAKITLSSDGTQRTLEHGYTRMACTSQCVIICASLIRSITTAPLSKQEVNLEPFIQTSRTGKCMNMRWISNPIINVRHIQILPWRYIISFGFPFEGKKPSSMFQWPAVHFQTVDGPFSSSILSFDLFSASEMVHHGFWIDFIPLKIRARSEGVRQHEMERTRKGWQEQKLGE